MGLLSLLGKIGAGAAAPFVGGATLPLIGLGGLGGALSGFGPGGPGGPGVGTGDGGGFLGGLGGILGKIFNQDSGLDPTTLLLAALAAMGGGQDQQTNLLDLLTAGDISPDAQRLVNPVNVLAEKNRSLQLLGSQLANQDPASLSAGSIFQTADPINIPGVPFQFGGGLARDPAIADPSILEAQDRGVDLSNIFPLGNILTQEQQDPSLTPRTPTRRRSPNGAS